MFRIKIPFCLITVLLFISFVNHAVAVSIKGRKAEEVEKIVVEKGNRRLALMSNGTIIKTYPIVLGNSPRGHKTQKGDKKTPEGIYQIDFKNPNSKFHKSLHISYPNEEDISRARSMGVSPGGDIVIHGLRKDLAWFGKLHRLVDWTDGCIALTNDEIDEIWSLVPLGTIIEIRP